MGDSKAAMFVPLTQEVVSLTASSLYTTWNAPEACVETGKRDCNIREVFHLGVHVANVAG